MKLRKILARIQQGDRTFFSGDGYLQSASVSLGEGDRSSTCTYTISDPKLKISQALFSQSFDSGGIEVPPDLLAAPEPPPDTSSGSNFGDFESLEALPEGTEGDELANAIVQYARSVGVTDPDYLAAILGTCAIESAMGRYLEEIDDGSNYAYLAAQGIDRNLHGRGLVQITGRDSFEAAGRLLGIDLLSNPAKASELKYAIPLLVLGMRDGIYTGVKLSDCG